MFTFLLSELLILREKKVRGFFFAPLEYQKKLQIFKKYLKNTKQESCAKKGKILHQAAQIKLLFTHNLYIYIT